MKKLLTFLTLLTLFFMTSWAETAEFSYTGSGQAVKTVDGITITIAQGTSSTDPATNSYSGSHFRIYKGNTITVDAGTSTIQSVVFTCESSTYASYWSYDEATEGTISVPSSSTTVTLSSVNASSTTITHTGSATRIIKAVVTYTSGGSTPDPTYYSLTLPTGLTGGSVSANGASDLTQILENTSITVTATPATGYTLEYMKANGVNVDNPYTFNISENTTITASFAEESTPEPSTDQYELVTDASSLDEGDQIIIASTGTDGSGYALSTTQNDNNRGATSAEITNSIIVPSSSVQIITLEKEDGNWLFNVGNGYLYAASSSKNWLRTETTPDANAQATISISSNAATVTFQGTNTRNTINYNPNNGNPIFSCYASGTVYIYKKVESAPQSSDVFIVGQINGHDSDPWNTSEGVQLTYNSTNDNYAANIYCTGMKNGNDDGYSYFLFAKSLPFSWDNTSNLYGSGGNGSYWGIGGNGESAFGSEIPLYEGSKDSFRLPAGLYTVTVDLDYTHQYTTKSVKVTKRDVTLNVTNSATFETTKNVTMTSNLTELGGKIYYTTNGNDPRDQYSGRQEYTEQLTLDATTTIKAVAVLGCIYSDVVEKTYTKKPAAPVITPASCTFNEPLSVTITAESGATIYYTTDGSDPTNESTQYNGPFTVSATSTVKAIAYVGEAYSNIATATYTYSNVQPSTGDFVLVESADQLVAGNEYIIVTTYGGSDYAMGALTTGNNPKGSRTTDFTITGTVGTSGSRITAGNEVNVLTLGSTGGAWTLKQSDESYITLGTNTNISSSSSTCALTINISNNVATIQGPNSGPSASTPRQILHQAGTSNCFGNYASSNVGGNNFSDIYLYTRATNTVQPPVFSPIAGIYNVDIDVTISCATDGATIYYTTDGTEPSATNGTEYTGEIIVSESTTFKAIAIKDNNASSVVTAAYTINKNTEIATVTLTYSEPFTAGIGDFTIDNVSGFSPVWSLDGNYGVKGTSYSNGTNYAAQSRLVSPIIDMTGSVQPELTFSHQNNGYFNDITTQCQVFIRETTDGTDGTWVQIPITFTVLGQGNWSNDLADIDLTDINGVSYADKKVQISFLYTNPTEGSGAGTWEIQSFRVADNSEYRMVNNIAEFLALENGEKAKFKNPVTVLYDYAQYGTQEYIWFKDESGYSQFFLKPTLNSDENTTPTSYTAFYENGDIIPAGFTVVKNYYNYGAYLQAFSDNSLNAGFLPATQKGLADPEHFEYSLINSLTAADTAIYCNRYITLEKIRILSKNGKNFTFSDENSTTACKTVGFNKFSDDGSLEKDGSSAVVPVPDASTSTYYNVKAILQVWKGNNDEVTWEILPIEFTEWKADEVTLRKLCADGVETHEYKISNNLLGVYASADGTKLWVKDDNGQSICPVTPVAPYTENFAIEFEDLLDGNNNVVIPANTRLEQQYYDQSNWCEIQLTAENASDFVGKIINGGSIQGTFTNKTNPTMTGVTLTSDNIYSDGSYEPNYYIPCNFYGNQSCQTSQHGQPGHGDFFFMTPKPQEYAMVVWAIWDSENDQFVVNENPQYNSHGFQGSFKVDLSLNQNPNIALHDGMDDNFAYNFSAIIRVNSSKAGNDFMVYPLDLSAATDPATAIESVVAGNGEVKSVKFYNVAGIESATPFQGVNIVVTEYTDGSRTTSKMLRK